MTTDTVTLLQMLYQAQMDSAELTAYGLGLTLLVCVLLLWLCVAVLRGGA